MDRISLLALGLQIAFVTLVLVRPAQRIAVRTSKTKRRAAPPAR